MDNDEKNFFVKKIISSLIEFLDFEFSIVDNDRQYEIKTIDLVGCFNH